MWYQRRWWAVLFLPLSWLYVCLSLRRKKKLLAQQPIFSVPIIVVGNISVGGTGKTPLVTALAKAFTSAGLKPGIVSRGYGSKAPHYPFIVNAESNAAICGDEPLLLAQRCQCPVVIDADRCAAIKLLIEQHQVDVIISDDGLQHYRMPRSVEIAVVDTQRGMGNGWCLPAGPLREGVERLRSVDFVVINGTTSNSKVREEIAAQVENEKLITMQVSPVAFVNLGSGEEIQAADDQSVGDQGVNAQSADNQSNVTNMFSGKTLRAVSGIGNPQRFFQLLDGFGLRYTQQIFPDHHHYVASDLNFSEDIIITTEKDAVKWRTTLKQDPDILARTWYLKVAATLDKQFTSAVINRIFHNPTLHNSTSH